jgi:hypothetical protein
MRSILTKRLPLAAILLSCGSAVLAAPVVTGVAGTMTDNQTIVIIGSQFGSNSLRQNWLGGSTGPVDSQPNGARIDSMNLPGWSLLQPSTATYPHVSTERGWSGGKSIAFDTRNTTEYKQTLFLDLGAGGYNYLYTNGLIYLHHDTLTNGARLQWKMLRWTRSQTVVDGDGAMMSNWPGSMSYFSFYNPGANTRWFNENGLQSLPTRDSWYRYETWVQFNSSSGNADGVYRVKVTNPTNGAVVVDNTIRNVAYNGSGQSGNYRYLVLQNYFGNASDGGSGQKDNANAVAWWDDLYVSQSQARVEVCGASTWAACTNREIQPASSWSDGSITVRLNKGGLSAMSGAYLYVTDSSGVVNAQGFRLSGGGTIPNPASGVNTQ